MNMIPHTMPSDFSKKKIVFHRRAQGVLDRRLHENINLTSTTVLDVEVHSDGRKLSVWSQQAVPIAICVVSSQREKTSILLAMQI
jgi:hypothetical protein